ncbi:MAG: squalene/phytoene synthase family protein [Alphaproteobacteria bacterium]|nr:squalene/phytoene synthase family protein [Alphaproteobacteria bacterium]MDP6872931.1 squalene/phytoene synthase family protein [Alphaproteobacteria bacterium]
MTGEFGGRDGNQTLDYCLGELRRADRDRYLTLLFAPRAARPLLAALYAFNLECARAVVAGGEQPLLGQMRLQWWRDALEGAAAGGGAAGQAHPVLSSLLARPDRLSDMLPGLRCILAARERDLTDPPFASLADVLAQARDTGGALVALAAGILADDDTATSAARAAGTAYALAGMLRAIRYQAPGAGFQGRLCLPLDVLARHGVAADVIWSGDQPAAVAACVAEVAAAANEELATLANYRPKGSTIAPLLHGSLARAYLRRLARAGHDPFAPDLGLNPLSRPLMLCWRALLHRP